MDISIKSYFFVACIFSVVLFPIIIATESFEKSTDLPDSSINDINKIIGNSAAEVLKSDTTASSTDSTTEVNSTTTTKDTKISPDDLEKSHSELTESKLEISKDGSSKDESLGTANSFPIAFANKIPFNAPLVSGAYGQQNQFLPGDVGQYLGYPGSDAYPVADLSKAQLYSQLSQPFIAKDYSLGGIIYGENPAIYGAAIGSSGVTGQPIYANKPEFQYGGIQKSLYSGYPNPYQGGVGQGGYGLGSYGYEGINPYGNLGPFGIQKSLLANQYPVTLSGGFQQYSNPGFGLNTYQQFGGYGHQKSAAVPGVGYQNPLAYQSALGKIRHQANPYYKQYDPIYSQPGGNKLYQRKSPYGFYTTDA